MATTCLNALATGMGLSLLGLLRAGNWLPSVF